MQLLYTSAGENQTKATLAVPLNVRAEVGSQSQIPGLSNVSTYKQAKGILLVLLTKYPKCSMEHNKKHEDVRGEDCLSQYSCLLFYFKMSVCMCYFEYLL